jgi:uncharacterized protein YdbL (DUF1318 family)
MKKMPHTLCLFLFAFIPLIGASTLHAESPQEAAQRIKERLPQVDAMKAAGEVGEDANGLLAELKPLGPRQSSLVTAENADRRVIYESVAARTGQDVLAVGQQRAIRIAELAKSGVWLQRPDGEWYRKP